MSLSSCKILCWQRHLQVRSVVAELRERCQSYSLTEGPLAFYKGFVPNFGRFGRIMECDHVLNFGTGEKTFCKGGAKSTYPPEKLHKGVELLMKFFS
ncbi:hypothetical protein J5N97_011811 [Dioscorea zingiberensis]|uniref:Uncharacterized protein n=1 Tax=Dioscorea zingiberensis TaxID=325984 RepID=A0A9D5D163_9LILI|nr:hypothetical protein J5N97_011811 [Dioscorea zingiberensis]